ncbi:hypothetical protein CcNV_043 [Crangon crangon nudivirus]|uniref:Uncharacterized protein n=1 Tax=Crangon crangon nudivirus TaxID=2880838 RepID=A0AAE9BZ10_9VIRU|nr:hypothetical protein QKT25_gp043 [Crangon crangon nudivirus]UBZ25527.1 hypothetical protein CcNV_043 [Crangon crangon nudivirus]
MAKLLDNILDPSECAAVQALCLKIDSAEDLDLQTEILDWLNNGTIYIVQNPIPEHIIPGATLENVLIRTDKRNTIDTQYARTPELQRSIPRGLCLLNRPGAFTDTVIYANRKFNGPWDILENARYLHTPVPESEAATFFGNFFLEEANNVTSIILSEKMDGDPAQFSVRYINNKYCITIGTHNNHIMICDKSDIAYYTAPRFLLAKQVAHQLMSQLEKLPPPLLEDLLKFLINTRATVTCQYMNPKFQHVVDIHKPAQLIVVALTCRLTNSLLALPTALTYKIFTHFGFNVPNYTTTTPLDLTPLLDHNRSLINTEGVVAYYQTKDNRTIGITKEKTYWYMYHRIIKGRLASFTFNNNNIKYDKTLKQYLRIAITKARAWCDFPNFILPDIDKYIDGIVAYLIDNPTQIRTVRNYPQLRRNYEETLM